MPYDTLSKWNLIDAEKNQNKLLGWFWGKSKRINSAIRLALDVQARTFLLYCIHFLEFYCDSLVGRFN